MWILYIGDRKGGREDVMTSLCVENSMWCGCERICVPRDDPYVRWLTGRSRMGVCDMRVDANVCDGCVKF